MGEMLFQGTINDLYNLKKNELKVRIKTDNPKLAVTLLKASYSIVDHEDTLDIIIQSTKEVNDIIHLLINNNVKVYEAVTDSKNLEQIFLSMTQSYTVS
jgi:ABC-2 type transport system ATP-binding protein